MTIVLGSVVKTGGHGAAAVAKTFYLEIKPSTEGQGRYGKRLTKSCTIFPRMWYLVQKRDGKGRFGNFSRTVNI